MCRMFLRLYSYVIQLTRYFGRNVLQMPLWEILNKFDQVVDDNLFFDWNN